MTEDKLNAEDLKSAFNSFDLDKDGTISKRELVQVFGELGVELSRDEAKAMIRKVDKNNDSEIDFEEFKVMFKEKMA